MDRDFARTPWEPEPVDESSRPGRGWRQTAIVLGLAFVIAPLALFGGRFLLARSASGMVTFSSQAADCTANDKASAFPAGSTIYGTVVLERGVSPGEVFTVRLLRGDNVLSTVDYTVEESGNCASRLVDEGTLSPGNYRVTYFVGDEALAEGSFDVR